VQFFTDAKQDDALVLVEGFHAVKHALRFGAKFLSIHTADRARALGLARELAPDVESALARELIEIPSSVFAKLSDETLHTGVLGLAQKPGHDIAALLSREAHAPAVLLDNPTNHGNVGAVIRVAAAAGAGAVLTTGIHDPWARAAIRGASGLHFALPVARVGELPATDRPLYAIDPEGEAIDAIDIPGNALLAFGSERRGLSAELLARAARRVAIPMRKGISSLNLATAVAVALYHRRLGPR
jgi:tRNA G18 (ribose-2'-O)-methylase SpoU